MLNKPLNIFLMHKTNKKPQSLMSNALTTNVLHYLYSVNCVSIRQCIINGFISDGVCVGLGGGGGVEDSGDQC